MDVEELFQKLYHRAEQKEDSGSHMEAIADYHKMLSLLSGDSLRSTGFTSFHHNNLMQIHIKDKVGELSDKLPLAGTIFKLAGVGEGFTFSFDNSFDVTNSLNGALLANESLNSLSEVETYSVPADAPKLTSLFSSQPVDEKIEEKRVIRTERSKQSFSYSKNKKKVPIPEEEEEDLFNQSNPYAFSSASEQLRKNERKKLRRGRETSSSDTKTLGGKRRFNPTQSLRDSNALKRHKSSHKEEEDKDEDRHPIFEDERMDKIEERMAELILSEILESNIKVSWKDIAGLEFAKKSVMEIVVYPLWRPELFHGIRRPAKGLLLFGPPGTGKTMIGKAIASEAGATFFNISASSLTSKYVGEGEKMVRALFTVARCYPADMKVIFIDEVDSLLTQRTDNDVEASRRIKTEFLVQMDGAGNDPEERILVVGATNRPQEIDEAARRRFLKRLYIPLPNKAARKKMMENLLRDQKHTISDEQFELMATKTKGYSGSDMAGLCSEAAFGPIRCLNEDIRNVDVAKVRPISMDDFEEALGGVRASVGSQDLKLYEEWNTQFGSFGDPPPID